jgi:hypothetical protein
MAEKVPKVVEVDAEFVENTNPIDKMAKSYWATYQSYCRVVEPDPVHGPRLKGLADKTVKALDGLWKATKEWKRGDPPPGTEGVVEYLNQMGACINGYASHYSVAPSTVRELVEGDFQERLRVFMKAYPQALLRQAIVVHTPPIVLEDRTKNPPIRVHLGIMEMTLNVAKFWAPGYEEQTVLVGPVTGQMDLFKGQYFHPHVSPDKKICMGDFKAAILSSLRRFDLLEAVEMVVSILQSYDEKQAYIPLEKWVKKGKEEKLVPTFVCQACGGEFPMALSAVYCEHVSWGDEAEAGRMCKARMCRSCFEGPLHHGKCPRCDTYRCLEHLVHCVDCGELVCSACGYFTGDWDPDEDGVDRPVCRCEDCHEEYEANVDE